MQSGAATGIWRDPSVPVAERVDDLLGRMTLREKVAQLSGVWLDADGGGGDVAPHQHDLDDDTEDWSTLITHGVGQLTRPFGTAPVEPVTGARTLAGRQREIVSAGRFGIPALVHEECLTGLTAWRATIYPSPLCWGASFDPDLVQQMAFRIGSDMRRLGVHQGLAPVLDVARDLRWGRIEETIAEDPFLVGSLGAAYVRGLQSAGVVATLKHFLGYSASAAGRNLGPVSAGPRELSDVLLPPFEMALRAGARSVMNAYPAVDGLPAAADRSLLTGLLREKLGFDGTVVSDYFSVTFLQTLHGLADSPAQAAALALQAGIDVELPAVRCYGEPLVRAVESSAVDGPTIDRAAGRVLRQKCELGLLDPDWSPDPPAGIDLDDPRSRRLARRLAARSIVLLRNQNGALPLPKGLRLAVIGPRSAEAGAMLGCYSFPMHVGVHHPDVPLGLSIPTLLETLRTDPAGYHVTAARGCPVAGGNDDDIDREIAAAADLASAADVCLAVLGDRAGLFGAGTSGEGCDAADLALPGRQEDLLEALLDTGTPVVLVLLVGRPYELSRQVDRLAAALCGFFPGEEGAAAVADVLAGRADPGGRLPVSFPAAGATQPGTYLTPALGQRSEVSSVDPTPLFPFGHGLSYAPARWLQVSAAHDRWPTDGSCTVTVRLDGDPNRVTSEVVQVYLHDPVAEVSRPVQQLIAAPRVDLAPGGTGIVRIDLHADLTSYTGRDGRRRVDPGAVELRIGASSTDIRGTLALTMTGPARFVGPDRVLQPTIQVDVSGEG